MTASVRLAVQEDMLPGPTIAEKFAQAENLGIAGIEFWSRDTTYRQADIQQARALYAPVVSSIAYGRRARLLDAFRAERDRALAEVQVMISECQALGAKGIIIVPHYDMALIPDLSPFKTAIELEVELLTYALSTLAPAAEAADVELYIEPLNRYETHFINRLEQAIAIVEQVGHPSITVAASLFHMTLEEDDPVQALQDHIEHVGLLYLATANRRLPGPGLLAFEKVWSILDDADYHGWLCFECGTPGNNAAQARTFIDELPASLEFLANSGFKWT